MEKRNTRIKIKKKGKGRRAKLVRVSEIMKNARPGAVALPGVTKSRAAPSVATKGAGKAKGVELREPRYDLLNELDDYLYPSPEDDSDEAKKKTRKRRESAPGRTFDAVMRVRQIPSLTMAVLESIYAQEVPVGERRLYPMAGLVDFLMHSGLVNLQGDPDVDGYRAARLDAITDAYADPSAKVSLRGWLRRCSYIAPAAHGGTEDATFRVTPFISTLASALAVELGTTRYSLVAAVLAGELALLSITDAEHKALQEQSDALLDEIATRRKELTRRAKTAKTKKGKP